MPIWKQIVASLALVMVALVGAAALVPGAQDALRKVGLGPVLDGIGLSQPEGGADTAAAGGGQAGGNRAGGPPGGAAMPEVTAMAPGEGRVADRVSAIGDGRALRSVTVFAQTPGRVADIRVRSGERVTAGDVLLQLDNEAETIALERAKLMQEDTLSRLERAQQLRRSGTGTDVQLREAELALRQAELELRQAEFELAQRTVQVPVSGWIGILNAEIGAQIGTQTEIARIDDRSVLLVDFRLPERMVGKVAVGDPIMAEALAGGFGQIEGRINAIDNRVDPVSRTLRVQAQLDNSDDRLRAGMAFAITIDLPGEVAPYVDPLSVQWSREGAYVWVIREGKAQRLGLRILQRSADRVLVQADFQPGDLVVIEGVQSIRPGAEVQVRNTLAANGSSAAKATP